MNINCIHGIVVLLVLASVEHTANCSKPKVGVKKPNNDNDKQAHNSMEDMLLKIATIIQECVDKKTMNNKDFKRELDNLYSDIVKPEIKNTIKKYTGKVKAIKDKFEKDQQLLMIIDNYNLENKNKIENKKKKSLKWLTK